MQAKFLIPIFLLLFSARIDAQDFKIVLIYNQDISWKGINFTTEELRQSIREKTPCLGDSILVDYSEIGKFDINTINRKRENYQDSKILCFETIILENNNIEANIYLSTKNKYPFKKITSKNSLLDFTQKIIQIFKEVILDSTLTNKEIKCINSSTKETLLIPTVSSSKEVPQPQKTSPQLSPCNRIYDINKLKALYYKGSNEELVNYTNGTESHTNCSDSIILFRALALWDIREYLRSYELFNVISHLVIANDYKKYYDSVISYTSHEELNLLLTPRSWFSLPNRENTVNSLYLTLSPFLYNSSKTKFYTNEFTKLVFDQEKIKNSKRFPEVQTLISTKKLDIVIQSDDLLENDFFIKNLVERLVFLPSLESINVLKKNKIDKRGTKYLNERLTIERLKLQKK